MRRARLLPAAGLLLAGCGALPYAEESQTSAGAPPAERGEVAAAPATPGQIWIPGRWTRDGETWQWQTGRYVQPPDKNKFWVSGAWNRAADGGWRYTPGAWRPAKVLPGEEPVPEIASIGPGGEPLLSLDEFLQFEMHR